MIWLLHICFSLAVAGMLGASSSVSGRVELRDSREKSVRSGRDYSGVVVWLQPQGEKPEPAVPSKAVMLQKDKKFTPHVLAIRTGTSVEFPNHDPIFHNAFSQFSGQVFDVGLYKPGSTRTVTFNRPGAVRVFCNIHAAMSAVIVVLDTPWFAVTSPDGTFRISGVPPGEYRLNVFHERATPAELEKLSRRVQVNASGTLLSTITVSESGYLPVPHLNKHGRPYRKDSEQYKVIR